MSSVFASSPVSTNNFLQLLRAFFLAAQTGGVVNVFLRTLHDFSFSQFLSFAPDRNKLPTATQARIFRIDLKALQAAPFQPAMFLDPARIVLRGKKNAEEA